MLVRQTSAACVGAYDRREDRLVDQAMDAGKQEKERETH